MQKIIPIGENDELVHDENGEGGIYEEVDQNEGDTAITAAQLEEQYIEPEYELAQEEEQQSAFSLFLLDLLDYLSLIDYACLKSTMRWFMEVAACHISISVRRHAYPIPPYLPLPSRCRPKRPQPNHLILLAVSFLI